MQNSQTKITNEPNRVPLTSICRKLRGVSYKRDEVSSIPYDNYVPVLRANNITDEGLVFSDLVYVPPKCVAEQQYLQSGDVVIAMSSGSKLVVGKAAQLKQGWTGSFGAFCGVLRVEDSKVDPDYFGYYFNTKEYRSYISDIAAGTNINNLKNEHFDNLEFPLPDIADQKKIVHFLDNLLPSVRSSQQKISKARAKLQQFRQSVLSAAVTGKLTEEWREKKTDVTSFDLLNTSTKNLPKRATVDINVDPELPSSWCYSNIDPLLDWNRRGIKTGPFGSALKKYEHKQSGIPVLGIENITKLHFVPNSKIYITKEKAEELKSFDVHPNDVIMSRSGTIGEFCVVPEEVTEARFSTNIIRVALNTELINPYYFCYILYSHPDVTNQINQLAGGSTRAFISQQLLRSLRLPIPPIDEQIEIIKRVENLLNKIDLIDIQVRNAETRAEKLTQSILAKAFRGEL